MSKFTYLPGGDIFKSRMAIKVMPMNTAGIAGKGLAMQFAGKFPRAHQTYRTACMNGALQTNRVVFAKDVEKTPTGTDDMMFCLFATKRDWRQPSQYEYIRDGLLSLRKEMDERGWTNCGIAFPMLGCGLGKLDWDIVQLMIECAFASSEHEIELYGPRLPGFTARVWLEWGKLMAPEWLIPEERQKEGLSNA